MKKIGLLLLGVIFYTVILAQENTAHQWYFGENAGVDFSTGIPIAKTDGQITGWEGCATIGDINGNLLFYTDGQNVYNRNHQLMQNGGGLMGSWSASQSSIICPYPGNDSLFYIFTVDAVNNQLQNGLRYSIVNMNLDGGNGAVTSTKNILLQSLVAEKLTAVMHANTTDYWVIAHKWNSNEFVSFKITTTGIDTTPVISAVGTVHQGGYSSGPSNGWTNALGCMKANMNGTKIAVAIYRMNLVELFDFDNTNGTLSNCFTSDNVYIDIYGVEFSPNSNFLYASMVRYDTSISKIHQFNLTQTNPLENPILIHSGSYSSGNIAGYCTLQTGPNGKIYTVDSYNPYLSVINEPNNLGVNCNFEIEAVYLDGKHGIRGLPTIFYYKGFQFFTGSEQDTSICEGDSILLENAYQVIADTYYDTVQTSLGWDSIINTHLEVLPVASTPTISENGGILTSSSSINYQWYYNGNLISGATSQTYQPFVSGIYQVVVNNNECETWSDEYNFTYTEIDIIQNDFTLYPNPVSNVININYTEPFYIKITDLNGCIIYNESIMSKNKNVDISFIKSGVYLLKIITPTKVKTMKIIKQ